MATEEGEVGFEEGMLWLPSQVLDEACDTKAHIRPFQQQRHHRHHRRVIRSLPADELPLHNSKSSPMPPYRPKFVQNWASGGPGMQAIFLDSGQKSCGTGVFLPQRTGNGMHPSNKKPACAPVLLPSRVVQALNLNVHALGLQLSPRQDPKNNRKVTGDRIMSVKNKKACNNTNKDARPSSQCFVISQKRSSSPELFLPKEWTY
ncbi:hypothetical protein L484_025061 [Morus notabilis]|uniref:Uncharacterized protein n=1 Tax=Morus notabilis TaxID=981085 RepID=W9R722_9ROSA|nr:hypothetical protein L484_025061 [Morus notabilis]